MNPFHPPAEPSRLGVFLWAIVALSLSSLFVALAAAGVAFHHDVLPRELLRDGLSFVTALIFIAAIITVIRWGSRA